jgi:hypothetical protein
VNSTAKNINITITICEPNVNCTNESQYENCSIANEAPANYLYYDCPRYSFNYQELTVIRIVPNTTNVYLDGLEIIRYYPAKNVPLLLMNEQDTVIYYSPTIIKQITRKHMYGLAGGEGEEYVNFNLHADTTTTKNSSQTILKLIPMSMDIYYQEESYYDRNY